MGLESPAAGTGFRLEAHVQQFADNLPLLLCVCAPDGQCCYLNRRWRQFAGGADEQPAGDIWFASIHPEDQQRFEHAWVQALSTGEESHTDYRLKRHDGVYRWFEIRARAVRDMAGKVSHWMCVHTDIQERVDAREALLQSERRFRGLYHSVPVSIWLEDWGLALRMLRDCGLGSHDDPAQYLIERPALLDAVIDAVRVVDVNDWALKAFRAQHREQLSGSLSRLFATPAGKAGFARKAVAIMCGEQSFHEDMELTALDGALLHVQSSAFCPSLREGHERVIVSRVDVTALRTANDDRKQAQLQLQAMNESLERLVSERTAELEQSRRYLQATLDAIPAIVVYLDRDLIVRYANLAAARNLNVSVMALVNSAYRELFGHEHYLARKHYFELALSGAPQSFEDFMSASMDSESSLAQVFLIPDQRDGAVKGMFVMLFDITSLKNAEAALRAANQELEAFSYAVAHDLRAPLRALSGFSSALLEDCAGSLNDTAKDYALEIDRAGQRMGALLEGLLTLSRSTQGEMRRDRIDLTRLAEKIAGDLQQVEPQRPVQWRIAQGLHAFGDAHMIELVLQNLLGNAWKYTQRIAAPVISLDVQRRDGHSWFCVSDNGAGFDMAHAGQLFKPFQRLHRQDEFVGIGIGLATVQRIVHRHGGEIAVESAPGQGARFCFTLGPQAQKPALQQGTNI